MLQVNFFSTIEFGKRSSNYFFATVCRGLPLDFFRLLILLDTVRKLPFLHNLPVKYFTNTAHLATA